jgi:predicted component of type VI protein secretion system
VSDPVLVKRVCLSFAVALLVAGCSSSSTPPVSPISQVDQSSSPKQITLYVAGMNKRLKVL